ncbi:MAG: MBL fold metallo-hydrolase [Clostridia bacterium]|nr:MBL fold metallo-hydrolase [Clostridia bacterium]
MKKMACFRLLAALVMLALVLSSGAAGAEIHLDQEPPAEWADREVMTLTAFPTVENDCTLLEVGGKSMLIDGGFKGWRYQLEPALAAMGYKGRVDVLFNTHPHDDHLGCVSVMVRDGFQAGEFISTFPRDYKEDIQKQTVKYLDAAGIPYRQIENGETMEFGGAQLVFWYYPDGRDPNALSALMHITFGDSTVLMGADTTNATHKWFHQHLGAEKLHADILKYPHHAYTAVSGDFMEDVNPGFVYVTNRARKTPAANKQLRSRHIPYYHTSIGRIVMVTDGTDWYIKQYTDRF